MRSNSSAVHSFSHSKAVLIFSRLSPISPHPEPPLIRVKHGNYLTETVGYKRLQIVFKENNLPNSLIKPSRHQGYL